MVRLEGDTSDNKIMLPKNAMFEDSFGIRELGLESLHLAEGELFINGSIDSEMCMRFASCLRYLARDKKNIRIFINSNGGEVNAGYAMYDMIQSYPGSIEITCVGMAASMAAVLLAGGHKLKRFILPHSRVMIHEPLITNGFGGSASTVEKTAQHILDVRNMTNKLLAMHTGRSLEEINAATSHDNEMSAEEAVEFGLCDKIVNFF